MKQIYLHFLFGIWLLCCAIGSIAQADSMSKGDQVKTEVITNIKIYPNPATSRFTLNTTSGAIEYITINNIIGKEIKKIFTRGNDSFDVSDLRRGVYIIRIFDRKDELVKAMRLSKI